MATNCMPSLPAFLGSVDQDIRNGLAALATGSEAHHSSVPDNSARFQGADVTKPDFPVAHGASLAQSLLASKHIANRLTQNLANKGNG